MIIAIGKYTPSYIESLREAGWNPDNGWTYRLAEAQIDDTCFRESKTYYTMEEALADIEKLDDAEFVSVLSEAVIRALMIKMGVIENPFKIHDGGAYMGDFPPFVCVENAPF